MLAQLAKQMLNDRPVMASCSVGGKFEIRSIESTEAGREGSWECSMGTASSVCLLCTPLMKLLLCTRMPSTVKNLARCKSD